MAKLPCTIKTQTWTVTSVRIKTRDGPARLEHAYRILLQESDSHPRGARTTEARDVAVKSGVEPQ